MAKTASTMLALGTAAPDFALPDVVSGRTVQLADFSDRAGLLVMFICQHCPFVKHVEEELAAIGRDYLDLGIVAISPNSLETHPQDGPEQLKAQAERLGFTFPYCLDETQAIAKAYTAACTPDFFLFDRDRRLVYRGQLDDSRPSSDRPVTGADLRAAITAVLTGDAPSADQKPSIGCNIKWHPGQEPDYYGAQLV
ncbi:thioredoxin family protein [Synechococcus elongatus]|nr:thioredoxin family protein [Synechococcus elongatus]AJD57752.1 alkyl hydroperoxide reductase [Synechococcus elongatus UTEX 2973]MBD2586476.1 thioredoxin family protein [Synechococcus elongatus FACHB-242]MBD2687550.1 thioredoxin family protein [Synechococcus elongatus FACHB-1061]MBD2706741.1 thioredoxin family protein [Synechococcus elongatus PCC 7942 = FACHB-805]UOW71551.1 thioredoxin family protein [Synechococcus elongatus PCC 7943]